VVGNPPPPHYLRAKVPADPQSKVKAVISIGTESGQFEVEMEMKK